MQLPHFVKNACSFHEKYSSTLSSTLKNAAKTKRGWLESGVASLVGDFKPVEKYARQIGSFPQVRGKTIKCLKLETNIYGLNCLLILGMVIPPF